MIRCFAKCLGLTLFFAANGFAWAGPRSASGEAFRDGMNIGRWSSAVKQFFGTAYEAYDSDHQYSGSSPTAPISRVWFTGAQGVLTEVFWPTIDTPQVRDSQFLVTDGSTFFYEERRDSNTRVQWVSKGVPAFQVTNADREGRFVIEKTIFSDPDRDVVIQRVRITRNVPGLKFYVLHNPSVGNTPMGNSALVSTEGKKPGAGLFAWQEDQAQAVVFSIPMKQASAGFEGASDGYQDIRSHLKMNYSFETATKGNVAVTAWLDIPETAGTTEFDIALGFGSTIQIAYGEAQASFKDGVPALQEKFVSQWKDYQQSLFDLSGVSLDGGNLFRSSTAVLKSMEDKTSPGAYVASPTIPWGEHTEDGNSERWQNGRRVHLTGGYHLVWPRDLTQMATTFMAVGDYSSAVASLSFLRKIQYGPKDGNWEFGFRKRAKDGSFPQNAWVSGEPFWGGLQVDETAMPVILTYRLWKAGKIRLSDYWDMVKRAADFIQGFGPWTPQERWEETFGASPSTIAAEITALWTAAVLAEQSHDLDRAQSYRATADAWSFKSNDNIDSWTYTTTGGIGNGHYFTRMAGASSFDEIWNPNSDQTMFLANNAGQWREKDVVDGGFLELVRYGVRSALDHHIEDTLPAYDASIRVDLPGVGPGFRRYTHDRYNYDDLTGTQTDGMLWPFLTGERGHYELQRAIESGLGINGIDQAINPYIDTMEKMATPTFMLPEQVWDAAPRMAKSTGSATPLGWTHGEYIKLLRSRSDRAVFDRIAAVAGRSQIFTAIQSPRR